MTNTYCYILCNQKTERKIGVYLTLEAAYAAARERIGKNIPLQPLNVKYAMNEFEMDHVYYVGTSHYIERCQFSAE